MVRGDLVFGNSRKRVTSPSYLQGEPDECFCNCSSAVDSRLVRYFLCCTSSRPLKQSSPYRIVRRSYTADRKRIVLLQSCVRRRQAKKELHILKTEARSAVHYKEVSYKLENKVVELTQSLQKRNIENKELQTKVRNLDQQLQSWMAKFDDADSKAKVLYAEAQKPTIALPEFEALDAQKREVDSKLEASMRKISEQESKISKIEQEYLQKMDEMKEQIAINGPLANGHDEATVSALRTELSALREQVTRQQTSGATSKVAMRPEGTAFNMATGRGAEAATVGVAAAVAGLTGTPKRRPRRHSDLGVDMPNDGMSDDDRYDAPRAVSVAYPQDGAVKRQGGKSYVPDVYDDPAEEIMKLLEDEEPLDEDVLGGIIRHLKVPSPNLQNPPSPKEVLFPAHLISLVTNEMWKYGMMRESERFLANVMQTVQQHVMVSNLRLIPGETSLTLPQCTELRR